MAVTDSPQTLSELRTDLLNRVREVAPGASAGTNVSNLATRYLNITLADIHMHRQWWWAERRGTIITKEPYSTGTIAVDKGSTSVTGSTTAWATADDFGENNARPNDKIVIGTEVYTISTVGSSTALTLTTRFTQSDLSSGGGYIVFQDEYALASDYGSPFDARLFSVERSIRLIGPKEFYRLYPKNSVRGTPLYATFIEIGPSGSASLRPRAVFGPAPDKAYTIPYRYSTTSLAVTSAGAAQANLSGDTDEPILPPRYRIVLSLGALYHWLRDRKDDARTQLAKGEYEGYVMRMANDTVPDTEDRIRLLPLAGVRTSGTSIRQRYGSARLPEYDAWDTELR